MELKLPEFATSTAAPPEEPATTAAIPADRALCATIHVLTGMDAPVPMGIGVGTQPAPMAGESTPVTGC